MLLTSDEIRLLLNLTQLDVAVRKLLREDVVDDITRRESGYSKKHGHLQAKLSVMLEVAGNREDSQKKG